MLVWCLILGSSMAVGLLWIEGHEVWASVCVAAPVLLYFKGAVLSQRADAAFLSARGVWRAKARRAGCLYCPECAEVLDAEGSCSQCRGAWLSPAAIGELCRPLRRAAVDWKARKPEDEPAPCPRCAGPLEEGDIPSIPSVFARCARCDGFWVPRVTSLWFELNVPAATRTTHP